MPLGTANPTSTIKLADFMPNLRKAKKGNPEILDGFTLNQERKHTDFSQTS